MKMKPMFVKAEGRILNLNYVKYIYKSDQGKAIAMDITGYSHTLEMDYDELLKDFSFDKWLLP